jgi:hypothetical protein
MVVGKVCVSELASFDEISGNEQFMVVNHAGVFGGGGLQE